MKARFALPATSLMQLAAISGLTLMLHDEAQAVDGCKVLLCMAGNWQNIAECEPSVREALHDVARGHGWPECSMGGSSGAGNRFVAAMQCPPQYRVLVSTDSFDQPAYSCPFRGVIDVTVDGAPWSRSWWSSTGDAIIEWLPAAKVAFAGLPNAMDTRFDVDHAAWLIDEQARLAAEAAAGVGAGQGNGG